VLTDPGKSSKIVLSEKTRTRYGEKGEDKMKTEVKKTYDGYYEMVSFFVDAEGKVNKYKWGGKFPTKTKCEVIMKRGFTKPVPGEGARYEVETPRYWDEKTKRMENVIIRG